MISSSQKIYTLYVSDLSDMSAMPKVESLRHMYLIKIFFYSNCFNTDLKNKSSCNLLSLGRVFFSVFITARSVIKSGALRQNDPIMSIIDYVLHFYEFLLVNISPTRYHLFKLILSKVYRDQNWFDKSGALLQNTP